MAQSLEEHTGGDAGSVDAVKQVCEQVGGQPELWDALASKGIEVTPGVVYQAMHDLGNSDPKTCAAALIKKAGPDAPGLTAEDLEALGALADKAGGVEQLIRILTVVQGTATSA